MQRVSVMHCCICLAKIETDLKQKKREAERGTHMKNEIFISYSTEDQGVVQQLVEYLEKNNYNCFVAFRDIIGGKHYAKDIVNVIKECRIVLFIASASSNTSEHVLNEIDICVEKRKVIIPFFIEDFEINDEFRYYLGRSQRVMSDSEDVTLAFPKILENIKAEYPKEVLVKEPVQEEEVSDSADLQKKKTVFEYNPERGIMINPEDRQRNVSFRTDTFINMMGGIYDKVKTLSSEEEANDVFFQSGFLGGSNFGSRLAAQMENSRLSNEERLEQWCRFDSQVGWGRFLVDIDIDEEEGTLNGTLKINECFIVDKAGNRRICSYIRGYCEGVIETLLGGVGVTLVCRTCPMKNKFKSECIFDIVLDES